jgi:hypothetical protein
MVDWLPDVFLSPPLNWAARKAAAWLATIPLRVPSSVSSLSVMVGRAGSSSMSGSMAACIAEAGWGWGGVSGHPRLRGNTQQ